MVMENEMKVPLLDGMICYFKDHPRITDPNLKDRIIDLFELVRNIEPSENDEMREVWVEVDRGSIDDFGTFNEFFESGEVENIDEFIDLWKFYYPDEKKWYNMKFVSNTAGNFLFINGNIILEITENEFHPACYEDPSDLVEFIRNEVLKIVDRLQEDEEGYNTWIERNLPFSKRYGRIRRSDLWKLFPEAKKAVNGDLLEDDLSDLEKIVASSKKEVPDLLMDDMTAGDFFEYCKLGYEAVGNLRRIDKDVEPRDLYLAFADGRDCGLTEIDPGSSEEFYDWYFHRSHCGGHPWEILRGGNSTHISLYVCRNDEKWYLALAGSSRVRAQETVKISLALFRNNIPFILYDADRMIRMMKGIDHIGIVPDHVFPVYCGSFFPEEDRISDFMNLGFEKEDRIIELSHWYPLDPVRLKR